MLEVVKGWVAGVVCTKGIVAGVETLSDRFRLLRISSKAGGSPGDKVQVHVGGLVMRTYSPFAFETGGFSLLAFLHGDSPASKWMGNVKSGDPIAFFGPRSSTRERGTIFGDETSIAVAASLGTKAVIETAFPEEATNAAAKLGVDAHVVLRVEDETHLGEVTARLRELGEPMVLTGRSTALVEVRKRLRAYGLSPKSKAYWAPGKKGLD